MRTLKAVGGAIETVLACGIMLFSLVSAGVEERMLADKQG